MQLYILDNYKIRLSGKIDKSLIEHVYKTTMREAVFEEDIIALESGLVRVKIYNSDEIFFILAVDAELL